jgi:hypothetical protein
MVRMLAGAMLETARGSRGLAWFAARLAGDAHGAAGPTAPAHALSLTGVRYAGDGAERDELRCLVVRGDGAVLVAGEEPPQGALQAEERVDEGARRIVREQTGVELDALPRPRALRVAPGVRVRDVVLEAPAGCGGRFALVAQP